MTTRLGTETLGKPSTWASRLISEERIRTFRIFFANRLSLVGLSIILFWLAVAVIGPAIAPYPYSEQHLADRLQPPGGAHVLGTDHLGRDVFSRILWGARITMIWGLLPIGVAMLIGVPTGTVAAYFGGRVEVLMMRTADLFLSIPALVLAVAIAAALGPSLFSAMVAVSIVWWPWYTRLMHAETLALKETVFVEAAKGLGASGLHIMARHILPNSVSTILVRMSMDLGFSVLYMAALGFIGMGAQPPSPEWGLAVSIGREYMPERWWMGVFPGLAVFTVVFGFNTMGDGVRDAFDPEIRGR
jgi:peptide/nickel transport system permease protein